MNNITSNNLNESHCSPWGRKESDMTEQLNSNNAKSLQSCLTLCDPWTEPSRSFCAWDSPGKNTGVGCHALLQGIFRTQGWNPHLSCLQHWQEGSLPLVPPGSTIISSTNTGKTHLCCR